MVASLHSNLSIAADWSPDSGQDPARDSASPLVAPEIPPAPAVTEARIRGGVWLSIALHLMLFGVLVWIGWPRRDDASTTLPLSVDLVALGPSTESPKAAQQAPVPQQRAAEASDRPSPDAIPPKARPSASAEPNSAGQKPSAKPALAAKRAPAPRDALSARLQQLASLAEPNSQSRSGLSNVTASTGKATGVEAQYGIKDFIRAQVMRRWYVADPTPIAKGWKVTIHMKLRPDGTVTLAEVVDMGPYRTDQRYVDFALSARNAVLLSSPLTIPAGGYSVAKELVLEFDPRAVVQ
jgi:membrane protein involved in colicin uptake